MLRSSKLRAVLLDIDGTLVDSNDAHAHAWVDVLAEAGHEVSFERVRAGIGKGGDKLLPELVGLSDESPEGKKISERRTEIFQTRYMPTLKAFPRVRELLSALRERGLRLVVATSAKEEEVDKLLEIANVKDLVQAQTTSDDAESSKPDADIVAAALQRARCAPDEAIMLGDTPYDVEAARKAGVPCIALRCGGWDDASLGDAAAVYADASDLLAHLAQSPFARAA